MPGAAGRAPHGTGVRAAPALPAARKPGPARPAEAAPHHSRRSVRTERQAGATGARAPGHGRRACGEQPVQRKPCNIICDPEEDTLTNSTPQCHTPLSPTYNPDAPHPPEVGRKTRGGLWPGGSPPLSCPATPASAPQPPPRPFRFGGLSDQTPSHLSAKVETDTTVTLPAALAALSSEGPSAHDHAHPRAKHPAARDRSGLSRELAAGT